VAETHAAFEAKTITTDASVAGERPIRMHCDYTGKAYRAIGMDEISMPMRWMDMAISF
jgi:hypothetical protein